MLNPKQIRALPNAAKGRDLTIIRLMFGTGVRLSEVTGFMAEDVGLDQGIAFIKQGKNRRSRVVPSSRGEARARCLYGGVWQASTRVLKRRVDPYSLDCTYGRSS
ncbi:MAG: tyrosine-type recombinase/integrase [Anaerolineae bacterium]|nr:tyrosine-type recombinase/integrase [Anaerolineae bacterium]